MHDSHQDIPIKIREVFSLSMKFASMLVAIFASNRAVLRYTECPKSPNHLTLSLRVSHVWDGEVFPSYIHINMTPNIIWNQYLRSSIQDRDSMTSIEDDFKKSVELVTVPFMPSSTI